ncbi:unnamed protein product [Pleuronectes platessa]|uniref:Secreted protein n=1 Tax=Pleuronectes platessa TaxID=8262 RepID=A0A9N7U3K3_PLEPL|nr:unnamed protein product [Pleuronectes platessa]
MVLFCTNLVLSLCGTALPADGAEHQPCQTDLRCLITLLLVREMLAREGQSVSIHVRAHSHHQPPLCAFASILSVMLTSSSARRHSTAVGEVGGWREGGKGDQEEWMSSGGMRGEDGGESMGEGGGRKREEGTERGARLQV